MIYISFTKENITVISKSYTFNFISNCPYHLPTALLKSSCCCLVLFCNFNILLIVKCQDWHGRWSVLMYRYYPGESKQSDFIHHNSKHSLDDFRKDDQWGVIMHTWHSLSDPEECLINTVGGFVQTALKLIKKITLQHFSSFSCYHFHNCASAMYEHPNKPDQENTVEWKWQSDV